MMKSKSAPQICGVNKKKNMETTNHAIKLAFNEYKKEFGDDAKLEDGEEFATVFNDGILIIGLEEKTLKLKILAGEPYRVDYNIDILEK